MVSGKGCFITDLLHLEEYAFYAITSSPNCQMLVELIDRDSERYSVKRSGVTR